MRKNIFTVKVPPPVRQHKSKDTERAPENFSPARVFGCGAWRFTIKDMEERQRMRRRGIIILTVVFFVCVALVTGYSIRHYGESLPEAETLTLTETEVDEIVWDGCVPMNALRPSDGGMMYTLYAVRPAEGPWGEQYFVTERQVLCTQIYSDMDGTELVPVACLDKTEGLVITGVVRENGTVPASDPAAELYEGREIRLK